MGYRREPRRKRLGEAVLTVYGRHRRWREGERHDPSRTTGGRGHELGALGTVEWTGFGDGRSVWHFLPLADHPGMQCIVNGQFTAPN